MPQIATVRVRPEWVNEVLTDETITSLAARLGCEKSTVSRQISGKSEASARFIGAVLTTFPIDFMDAFDVTVEEVRQRRARIVKSPVGNMPVPA